MPVNISHFILHNSKVDLNLHNQGEMIKLYDRYCFTRSAKWHWQQITSTYSKSNIYLGHTYFCAI